MATIMAIKSYIVFVMNRERKQSVIVKVSRQTDKQSEREREREQEQEH